eukprot:2468702-Prymnesium_polylepis.2
MMRPLDTPQTCHAQVIVEQALSSDAWGGASQLRVPLDRWPPSSAPCAPWASRLPPACRRRSRRSSHRRPPRPS